MILVSLMVLSIKANLTSINSSLLIKMEKYQNSYLALHRSGENPVEEHLLRVSDAANDHYALAVAQWTCSGRRAFMESR